MKQHTSGTPEMSHMHMHPAHWLSEHPMLLAFILTGLITLLIAGFITLMIN